MKTIDKLCACQYAALMNEIVLRNDGAGRDIGYVRSAVRTDGKVVTIYYFQDKEQPERYIGCTIWNPNSNF